MGSIRSICLSFFVGSFLSTVLYLLYIGGTLLREDVLLLDTSKGVSIPSSIITDCSLLEDSCLEESARKVSRVWSFKPAEHWCLPPNVNHASITSGLVLIKVPKAASSTSAAVALRIHNLHKCEVRWEHGRAREILSNNQSSAALSHRFLLAPLRAPESRALSDIYFHQISFHRRRKNNTPSENYILHHLRRTQSNFITDYIQLDARNSSSATESGVIEQLVRDILTGYDFLLVANRMDDSLVVFSLLANLPVTSILTMSSKIGGSWYYNGKNCIPLVSSTQTASTSTFFETNEWKSSHSTDRLLFSAVEISLDRTIAELGDSFVTRQSEFKRLKTLMQKICRNETYFPCSENGRPQLGLSARHCYTRDFGCGYPCIDRNLLPGTKN